MFNTHLFNSVHGSDEMPEATVVSRSVFIERTSGIFVGSLIHNVHENGAIFNHGGVRSRNRFADTSNIPVNFNGNCDRRGRYLYIETKYYLFVIANAFV